MGHRNFSRDEKWQWQQTLSVDAWPTYATYVKFCQDLTRSLDCLTTPQRCVSSLILPAQQSVVVGTTVAPNRGLVRDWQHELCELAFEVLKILDGIVFNWCGIVFHNAGPCTENDWSNKFWLAAELDLFLGGMTVKFPSLGRETIQFHVTVRNQQPWVVSRFTLSS